MELFQPKIKTHYNYTWYLERENDHPLGSKFIDGHLVAKNLEVYKVCTLKSKVNCSMCPRRDSCPASVERSG